MKKWQTNVTLVLGTVVVALSTLAGVAQAAAPSEADAGHSNRIYVPSDYTPAKKWPVVLLLHGYTANQDVIDTYFGFSAQVSKRGFILVTANGLTDSSGSRYWNATDGCCDFDHRANDDLAYLTQLIEAVKAKYAVDEKRVYVAGHSNGGFMAHRLACEHGEMIAAIASFAGETWQNADRCAPRAPVSVLQIQALDDDTIFYAGDKVGYLHLAPYPGAIETVNRWLSYDHCQALSGTQRMNLTDSISGMDTSALAWSACASGTSVELWTIDAHKGALHFPHTPLLREEFTNRVLDFLLQKRRE